MKANFMVQFDPITRQTKLPVDKNGIPYPLDWVHLTLEKENSVVLQAESNVVGVIEGMKLDLKNAWLEDKTLPPPAPIPIGLTVEPENEKEFALMETELDEAIDADLEKQTDAALVKAYLTTYTKVKAADLTKQVWEKPEDIIGNAVKAHGGNLESYRNSGLG